MLKYISLLAVLISTSAFSNTVSGSLSASALVQQNLGDFEGAIPFENEKSTNSSDGQISPEAKAYPESVIYVTKKGYKYTSGKRAGLEAIDVMLVAGGKVIETVPAVSGRSYAQVFRTEPYSISGSKEPAPEAVYYMPYGPQDVPESHHNYGPLGPWWIAIEFDQATKSRAPRRALGIHTDFDVNYTGKAGSLGCIATNTVTDIRKIVSWFNYHFKVQPPKNVIVDWGLGAVSAPL